ncbi:hypothetical protein QUB77_22505 [Microcoleus sp. AT9b-C3]
MDLFVMPNPKGHEDSIKDSRFKAAWQSGPTRTIRVPIVLADATLDYARQLDQCIEPHDTKDVSDIGTNTVAVEPRDTGIKTDSQTNSPVDGGAVETHDTVSIQAELEDARAENKRWEKAFKGFEEEKYELEWEVGVVRSLLGSATCSPTPPVAEFKLLEPAEVLNLLKGKRKKTQADLRDIEVVWQILEELTPDKGN